MLVRDIMETNVVTLPSSTVVPEAVNIMRAHRIERLPVVDKGILVGMVTKDTLLRASPSPATSLSIHEMSYLLSKLTIGEIMKKEVVTITPAATVEAAINLAQTKKVGCTPVVEGERVVGIVTTDDIVFKILNPLLGIGVPGQRIIVYRCGNAEHIEQVMGCINKRGVRIKSTCTVAGQAGEENNLLIHLDTEDASQIATELESLGYTVEIRQR